MGSWEPSERRDFRWGPRDRWLWCRVYDGLVSPQLAAEGHVDVRAATACTNDEFDGICDTDVEVNLYVLDDQNWMEDPNKKSKKSVFQLAAHACGSDFADRLSSACAAPEKCAPE